MNFEFKYYLRPSGF